MNPNNTSASNTPIAPAAPNTQSNPNAPLKLGKFKASRMIVKECWSILKQDTELMWFPVLSGIVSLVALIVMGLVYFFAVMGGDFHALTTLDSIQADGSSIDIVGYAFLLVYYLVMFFITNYFLAGVYIIVHARLSGSNLSLADGIRGTNAKIGKIFIWSLISATVGVILRIIADKFKLVGVIVASLLGAAWAILTYFSLPSLIVGNRSVKDSFTESAALIRKTWGETIIINFGVGLFFGLIMMFVFLLSLVIVVLAGHIVVAVAVGILFVVFLIVLSIISTTLGSIFKLALYEYALTGNIPQGFTPELVKGAVKAGK
jgi:hypothetical protein